MPRNSAGTYSLPEAPFVPNTPISSSAMNSNNNDIASALTDSLSRNGQGGMNALLGLSLSGFNYTADPDTGMSRSAANTQIITCGGQNWTFTTTDFTAPGGTSLLPLIGEIRMWALPAAPAGWLLMQGQTCTTSYPLWRAALIAAGNPYGTSGGDPLFPDLRCVVPAGVDTSRGILSGATLGALLGAQSVTLDTSQIPSHRHDGTTNGESASHHHQYNTAAIKTANATGATPIGGNFWAAGDALANSGDQSADHAHGFETNPTGGDGSHPNVQPTIILNFIGRAA